jgi:cyclic beta-1,2-glucan synthetase
VERLEQHAQTLAAAQTVTDSPRRGHAVGPRIAENGRVLLEAYGVLARAIKDEQSITPAAEWLLDNFHIVDEQLREIRDDLPPDYYRELPKLAEGHLAGYPRVLGITWAYIAHTDSRFEPESLRRMVRAYQGVEPLTIGELWAIAISLRILLVDNLRRIAELIVRSRADRQKADELADGCSASARTARRSQRRPCVGSRPASLPRRPASSSSSACAIRTPRSRRPSAGWRSFSRPRGPRPRR